MCIILPDFLYNIKTGYVILSSFSYQIFIFKLKTNCDNIANKKQLV